MSQGFGKEMSRKNDTCKFVGNIVMANMLSFFSTTAREQLVDIRTVSCFNDKKTFTIRFFLPTI